MSYETNWLTGPRANEGPDEDGPYYIGMTEPRTLYERNPGMAGTGPDITVDTRIRLAAALTLIQPQ